MLNCSILIVFLSVFLNLMSGFPSIPMLRPLPTLPSLLSQKLLVLRFVALWCPSPQSCPSLATFCFVPLWYVVPLVWSHDAKQLLKTHCAQPATVRSWCWCVFLPLCLSSAHGGFPPTPAAGVPCPSPARHGHCGQAHQAAGQLFWGGNPKDGRLPLWGGHQAWQVPTESQQVRGHTTNPTTGHLKGQMSQHLKTVNLPRMKH